ncbi:prepilin-type N-terminal cleavage/methylation domain-containing protein [Campylobacter jejuni]|uniref:Prepilin-type N-terminal cleavage/methylation domain-containing protein n=1 Tax=Campylobacter jejuni TaxID=197 RepID=A0A5T1MC61_CAMJU|nr:prepilin-type N-terminal cleavage/methylation domain-containing protein [Campylobacter jejuni]EAH5495504.1 prepilin-type N-terminal cleavage/methylation domain-containing protein [Campylobacter coli]EAH4564898.1 prepilin-type N-terminal cleavage/methylation domain-containing protein [Campylobacter jejuni]EAH4871742.1 prepilin-type N-terminal cleavage/methylation domain-containing protein [Campylobacter jejuni]EAH5080829.1 prepilin-type N-terminal cleavage/methylation domain-containing protei
MRKAFTILELVFVIVILGILAAIALPKMSSSKDEAEVSKSLNNLKTLINDISIYTLKNDHLSSIKTMSNVSGVENVDLGNFNGTKEVNFRVGDDKECLKLVFIDRTDFILMGISSNEASKNAIINAANQSHEDLENIDFTSSSSNKACVILSKNENFKNLASKTYLLIGEM